MNKWFGIGRLVADPDVRSTQSGKQVATYRMAVDRQFKQDGQPTADFLTMVAWGNNADFASKYLHKGIKIAVEARVQTRSYEDKDGKPVYVTEFVVERHEFCESKKSEGNRNAADIEDIDDDIDLPWN